LEATVRLGGLARAAVELNLATSAISHQSHTGRRETIVRRRRRPVAAGGRRDWYRHGQTFTVEVMEELGLPREISVASLLRRSWHRDDRPRGARGRARSTGHWRLRQRVVRCELRLHPTARVPSIPLATYSGTPSDDRDQDALTSIRPSSSPIGTAPAQYVGSLRRSHRRPRWKTTSSSASATSAIFDYMSKNVQK